MNEHGKKFDGDKLRFDLIPSVVEEEIAKILTFGAKKYGPDNWQKLDDFDNRYYAALRRHLNAWKQGEANDPESGMSHLSHALTNAVFLVWGEANNDKITEKQDDIKHSIVICTAKEYEDLEKEKLYIYQTRLVNHKKVDEIIIDHYAIDNKLNPIIDHYDFFCKNIETLAIYEKANKHKLPFTLSQSNAEVIHYTKEKEDFIILIIKK